jgi:chromosome segregation ATPase
MTDINTADYLLSRVIKMQRSIDKLVKCNAELVTEIDELNDAILNNEQLYDQLNKANGRLLEEKLLVLGCLEEYQLEEDRLKKDLADMAALSIEKEREIEILQKQLEYKQANIDSLESYIAENE